MTTHGQSAEREDQLWLVRHGETEWSKSGRHTSWTDLPLTGDGERTAASLKERLTDNHFDLVLTSPRQRARRTAELAGFPDAVVDDDLVEWNYGDYEGVTTAEIRETVPGWTVWDFPVPNGETPAKVTTRLDRVVARIAAVDGDVLVFGHSHALRSLTARWLELEVTEGRHFVLNTATISTLGWERGSPAILKWNS
ncbi:histidine phosphatase family protein [Kribbella sp. VKM Ac-2568]|uniref:histidine phosphatase family protein n=1 Tax=Kribbella sp. VKM Ac-2568 TaxID=2512219 RepID=UPI0010EB5C9F|nr:histidine phosphatase family protein [Kribbella sp. VKM Ac-2568]TCM48024.1 putative phosphoglycerate mutase [Kribbella sp. VKM Ac-2568]